jgi:hypothetical protein
MQNTILYCFFGILKIFIILTTYEITCLKCNWCASVSVCECFVLENSVLRRIFRLRGTRQQGSGEKFIMNDFIIYTPHPILCG